MQVINFLFFFKTFFMYFFPANFRSNFTCHAASATYQQHYEMRYQYCFALVALAVACSFATGWLFSVFSEEDEQTTISNMTEVELIAKNQIKDARTGEVVSVESLWAKQPAVIVFFRRWGCAFCRVAAKEISEIKVDLDNAGVRLVGIGVEDIGKENFIEGGYFKGDLFVDEGKKCYQDLKYKRFGMMNIIPAMVYKSSRDAYQKSRAENLGGDLVGDKYQVGGTLVISAGGEKVLYSHKQQELADHADPNAVLESLGIPKRDLPPAEKAQCSIEEKSACE